MVQTIWTPYWLMLQDELPLIGSGFRHVLMADAGKKWVRIKRIQDDQAMRVPRRKWDGIKKTENVGQSLHEVSIELQRRGRKSPAICRIG